MKCINNFLCRICSDWLWEKKYTKTGGWFGLVADNAMEHEVNNYNKYAVRGFYLLFWFLSRVQNRWPQVSVFTSTSFCGGFYSLFFFLYLIYMHQVFAVRVVCFFPIEWVQYILFTLLFARSATKSINSWMNTTETSSYWNSYLCLPNATIFVMAPCRKTIAPARTGYLKFGMIFFRWRWLLGLVM